MVDYPVGRYQKISAVSGVSFDIDFGETLGIVGESGCGKSTLARAIVLLKKPTAGEIRFEILDLIHSNPKRIREVRPKIQMIFQDAVASLNPVRRIGKSIAEPLRIVNGFDRNARLERARILMNEVGLDPELHFNRYPFEFSGGQCQRISIARALVTRPKLLICDEPVSSLDVSIQAQILNLLKKLRECHGLSMLFISHDLSVIKNVSDRVLVMYLGKLCEIGDSRATYRQPLHPYTATLLNAVLRIKKPWTPSANAKASEIPSPIDPPHGCRYHKQCRFAQKKCSYIEPELEEHRPKRWVACHYPLKS